MLRAVLSQILHAVLSQTLQAVVLSHRVHPQHSRLAYNPGLCKHLEACNVAVLNCSKQCSSTITPGSVHISLSKDKSAQGIRARVVCSELRQCGQSSFSQLIHFLNRAAYQALQCAQLHSILHCRIEMQHAELLDEHQTAPCPQMRNRGMLYHSCRSLNFEGANIRTSSISSFSALNVAALVNVLRLIFICCKSTFFHAVLFDEFAPEMKVLCFSLRNANDALKQLCSDFPSVRWCIRYSTMLQKTNHS
jgi:hypothetical protein